MSSNIQQHSSVIRHTDVARNARGISLAVVLAVVAQFVEYGVVSHSLENKSRESMAIYALFDSLDAFVVKNGRFPHSEAEFRSSCKYDGFFSATKGLLDIKYGDRILESGANGFSVSISNTEGYLSRITREKIVSACIGRLRDQQSQDISTGKNSPSRYSGERNPTAPIAP